MDGIFVGETLRGTELVRQVAVDEALRQAAWKRFKELRLPMVSFTDCTSFEVMDKYGIREAFTFDADFAKAGYRVLPNTM